MSGLQKNVASQNFTFCMLSTTTGAVDASATVTVKVTKDNGAQASGVGTVTNCGNGQYNYAPTQAETNATCVGFLMTATGDITVNYDFHTDIVDGNGFPSVNTADINGVTAATPGASGGILIAGTNAATVINGLTLSGTAAITSTPATPALIITGGAASTTSGGIAAPAIKATGGAGAASTNGPASGASLIAGNAVSTAGADGLTLTGSGNGNGLGATGGTTGNGILGSGGATSGNGIYGTAPTLGAGILAEGRGNNEGGLVCSHISGTGGADIWATGQNITGNLSGSVSSVLTGGLIDLTTTTYGEPSAPVGATATLKDMLVWLKTLGRNKITQTATTETLFKDDGSTAISTSTDSDDGTTFTRGKWS